jgi:hypothetical protein
MLFLALLPTPHSQIGNVPSLSVIRKHLSEQTCACSAIKAVFINVS